MISDQAWILISSSLGLTLRQLQIVRAMINGDTEYSIGKNLGISPHTVHTHMERVHEKLGVHDRVELLVRVFAEFLRLTADPAAGLPSICAQRAIGKCPLLSPQVQ